MDERRAETDRSTDINSVSLYGEFTVAGNRKVRCAVSLTEKDLTVQRLTSTPVGRNKVVLSLKDCVGCRAYRGDDNADPAAYLSAYFYPLKRRWMSSGVSRQRLEQSFRLAALQDPRANLEEAEKWARAVRERSARQQYLRDGECSSATGGKFRLRSFLCAGFHTTSARTVKNHNETLVTNLQHVYFCRDTVKRKLDQLEIYFYSLKTTLSPTHT